MAYDPWDLSEFMKAPTRPPSGYKPVTTPSGDVGYRSPSGNVRIDYASGSRPNPVTGNPWKEDYAAASRADVSQLPPWWPSSPTMPTRTTTSTRSGGGGGGKPAMDWGTINQLMGWKPKQYEWQNLDFQEFQAPAFREFNSGKWDQLRSGLGDAITADRGAGNASYDQLAAEMATYQNPWQDPTTIQNPGMSAAMQRMMQANNVSTGINAADTERGIQADQAFGNLGTHLALIAQQEQEARQRANQGYQRNFNERLDAEQRGGNLAVGMSEAQARELYERELQQYGFDVAMTNYNARTQNQQYNNQGINQTAQANTQMANETGSSNIQYLLDAIAGGYKPTADVLSTILA